MIAMSDKDAIAAKQSEIEFKTSETVQAIGGLIRERKDKLDGKLEERRNYLDSCLKKYVPSLPEAELQEIQEFARETVRGTEGGRTAVDYDDCV
jgi:hypothetical protein